MYVSMEAYTLFCTGKYVLCGSIVIFTAAYIAVYLFLLSLIYLSRYKHLHMLSVCIIFLKMCEFVCVVTSNASKTETVESAEVHTGILRTWKLCT